MALVELKQAAEMLGVTPEELNEMRGRNEIFAYRDGTTWKFKPEEIERVLALREAASEPAPGSDIGLDETVAAVSGGSGLDSDLDELIDISELAAEGSVLDDDAGRLDPTASSTVIGKKDVTDLDAVEGSDAGLGGSDLAIDLQPTIGDGSELQLAESSGHNLTADETGAMGKQATPGEDDFILDSDVGLMEESSRIDVDSPGELRVDSGSELMLAPSDTGINLNLDEEVDLDFAASDISLDPSKSGITLESPSDSGISLEQTPPEIAIGGDSLELGEADLLDLDDGLAELDDVTQLQRDQDFLLTPVEGELAEESDSGSQVIALDSEEFDSSASTLLTDSGVIATERGQAPEFVSADDEGTGVLLGVPTIQVPETQYTITNVLGLGLILLPLALSGLMMFDLIRHMWSWDEPYSLNSSLIDTITGLFGN
jgi:hypothetical protein